MDTIEMRIERLRLAWHEAQYDVSEAQEVLNEANARLDEASAALLKALAERDREAVCHHTNHGE